MRPPPQPPAVCYPNQSECSAPKLRARTEQTGHTDRWYAKETGKMSSEQDKDLVAKKKMHVAYCFVGFDKYIYVFCHMSVLETFYNFWGKV